MKYCAYALAFAVPIFASPCLKAQPVQNALERPKLVVGIVIDQMRWDYLYRYYDIYKSNGGFKRLLNEGFTCENTFIPYTPTVTAAGHTCVYTGSVPAIHGIIGNEWYDRKLQTSMYCCSDNGVKTVGSATVDVGQMSPQNMLATTITDELRLANNFKSKVIGIALKDRAAILPAGHSANAAYWYDSKTGNFISSTYYMNELPAWAQNFNNRKVVDSLYKLNWDLSLPKEIYSRYSSEDDEPYEAKPLGKAKPIFPYDLTQFIGKDYSRISSLPYGATLTVEMAKAAVTEEKMGKSDATDFLAVSFSSPDYIGHGFGPNSWEQLDDYARLDGALGDLFSFLDATIGQGQYTVFLTADHGVAHVPGYLREHRLPAGTINEQMTFDNLNKKIKDNLGVDNAIISINNYQLYLDHDLLKKKKTDEQKVKDLIVAELLNDSAVSDAFDIQTIFVRPMNAKVKDMMSNGYNQQRSGDIQIVLKPGYIDGGSIGTTHGLWNPYDSHIPLLFYGWGIKHGSLNRETYMTDISATIAALLHIQMPSGCVGKVIEEVMK